MESQSGKIDVLTLMMPVLAPEAHNEKLNIIYTPYLSLIISTRKILLNDQCETYDCDL